MGEVANIDARMQAALARLTDNEKECLRRRLQQQTAKEMALELGVSPHAVEKRLKMARAKLGLSSSLEAARLLAATEEYQRTGPHAADLDNVAPAGKRWPTRPLTLGVLIMITFATIALAIAVQGEGEAARAIDTSVYEEVASKPDGERRSITELEFVKASPERVRAYVRRMFDNWDVDRSGFVEVSEAPEYLAIGPSARLDDRPPDYDPARLTEELEGQAAQERYIANVDKDGDGKVSFEEFAKPVMPQFLERGIPLIPADWTPVSGQRD